MNNVDSDALVIGVELMTLHVISKLITVRYYIFNEGVNKHTFG